MTIARWIAAAAPYLGMALLATAVAWQTWHLVDGGITMYQAHGDGSLASYLRHHAYVYVRWFFGTDFGWTL
ncbi:hypothetical protein SDC9_103464 [bioreactor metagenome]|uniref:Uncharacterized protein n=1 Tax=bioreactor metagenome TaxID=1076179 RepID=A0A645ATQ0_9ZZZZ|nr:hypothetical protein [Candidatus Methanomethylophilaceae archaeon]MDD2779497.1 hypothetical protein [Candidatus Methanomethylophilaceae archaeon]MDD3128182.1 hypothetical protein [Candidatus Methanomethylophilaceae archaeon]MDD4119864.1 hypothetical protein [Candidatus Methanomethylophilaceae archaeon]MDD4455080.1 hypothetical protein [Candidatus Methanomethylophilaceae archaeon]